MHSTRASCQSNSSLLTLRTSLFYHPRVKSWPVSSAELHAIQADVQEHSLSVMTCLKEELPLPHLFKKHVNKQTYKISPGSKGPKSAVNSTKAGQAPRYQLSGHNGNLHTTAHLHLDLPGATSPNLLPSPKLCNFPELFLLAPQPWGQPW